MRAFRFSRKLDTLYIYLLLAGNKIRLVVKLMTRGGQEEENVSIVKRLYDAFRRREVHSIIDMFADDAVMHGPAPSGLLSWGGTYNDPSGVAEFFKALGESLEPQQFDLNDFIAQDNKVVVLSVALAIGVAVAVATELALGSVVEVGTPVPPSCVLLLYF
jgi:ketosteroid isomerase-like protein